MSKISPASRLAILFIRPFRSYLDGLLLIKESGSSLENDIKNNLDIVIESLQKYYPQYDQSRIEYLKECLFNMSMKMLKNHNKAYDSILPKIIEDLTIAIEAEINKSFSTQEIEEIIEIAQKPIIKKLLSNQIIFGLLKKYEIEADYQSNLRNYQDSLESNAINSMKKEVWHRGFSQ
jgi:hypothetical protein